MQGSAFAYDSFTRVNPRKKRKGKDKGRASATPFDLLTRVKEELTIDGRWSQGCKETFEKALHDACSKPRKVFCLGLGSPSSSPDARAQLALLSYLCASSDIDSANVFVYDPVFTDTDEQLFETLGMRCLDHIQGARYSLDCPTILYMPHCDLQLYENVIRANWTFAGLSNMVFLANRFCDYVDNNVASRLEMECPLLLRLVPHVECRPLATSPVFPNAFSSLAMQYVSRTLLPLQGDRFWDISPNRESSSVKSLGYKAKQHTNK